MGSDGMTLDELGNLYLTNEKRVTILDPEGNIITQIDIDEEWTSNVTFGGRNRDVLNLYDENEG